MLITQYLKTYFENQVVKQYGWDMDEVNVGGQVIPSLLCVIQVCNLCGCSTTRLSFPIKGFL